MKRSTNGKRWIVGLLGVMLALCLVPVAANATGGTEGEPAPQADGAVAKIGDVTYETLDAAIEAAKTSADSEVTVVVLENTTIGSRIDINGTKAITISSGADNKVEVKDSGRYGVRVSNDASLTFDNVVLTTNGQANLYNNAALSFVNSNLNMDGEMHEFSGGGYYSSAIMLESAGANLLFDNSIVQISNYPVQGSAIRWDDASDVGGYNINIVNGSDVTFTNCYAGFTGTCTVRIESSTVDVSQNRGNGGNGSHFEITKESDVIFNDNGSHGLSAGKLTIDNSTVTTCGNGGNGIHTNNVLTITNGSTVTVENNDCSISSQWTIPGAVHVGSGASTIENSTVTIRDNLGSGIYQKAKDGSLTIADTAKVTVCGNTASMLGYGGGIYVNGDVSLGSGVALYNNHAATAGDDIYVTSLASITLGEVGQDWVLDNTKLVSFDDNGSPVTEAADCSDAIDGWYDDSEDARWEAHEAPFHAVEQATGEIDGIRALKAAHGLVPIEPDDPNLPEWAASKSKTATELDEDNISNVTLSLPAEDYKQTMDVVFVIDDTHAGSGIFEQSVSDLLDELASKKNLDINVGIIAFDAVSRDWLDVTSNGAYSGLVSISDEGALNAIKTAVSTQLDYGGVGEQKKIGGTNTEWPVAMATEMLNNGEGEDKYLIMFSDMYGYVYRGTLELDGTTYTNVPMSKRNSGLDQGQLTIANVKWPNWDYVYSNYETDDNPGYDGFFRKSSWKNYWEIYQGVTVETDDQPNAPETDYGVSYFTPFEKSLCLTYDNIVAAEQSGVNVVLVNNDFDPGSNGGTGDVQTVKNQMLDSLIDNGLMVIRESTGNGEAFTSDQMSKIFSTLENELIQLVDKGSYVVDEMGSSTYAGVAYDFDFVNKIDILKLTVNGEELNVTEIDKGDATAAYQFGNEENSNQFVLKYYKNGTTLNGTTYGECFVWEINVPVKKDAPVQLTYSVQLDYPQTKPGTYGTYDRDGSSGYDGLYTNNSATLFPIDSKGEQGAPQSFYKPTVSYEVGSVTVRPAEMTIYMGGDQGYDTVVSGSGDSVVAESTNSLPEPGFYIDLSEDLNELLRDAQGTDNPGATDLSSLITFRTVSGDREWEFERYGGEAGSTAYDQFVYRLVPAAGQQPIRLEFTSEDGGTHFTSDDFDPMVEGALYNEYTMGIYAGDVNLNQILMDITIDGKVYTKVVNVETSTLNIRYVVDTEDGNPVTGVVNDINDAENPGVDAYAVTSPDATFYINGSQIDIARDAAPSLLFDSLVSTESGADENHFDSKLLAKATDAVAAQDESFQITGHESKYLDLVDANNGNAWLMTDSPVTIYWPYPEGTDENTEFYLTHFQGLDRDMANDEVDGEIDAAEPEYISVTNTEHGVMFTLQPKQGDDGLSRVRFSPFVLVWGESDEGPTGPTDETDTPQKPTDKPADTTKPAGPEIPETGDPTTVVSVATLLVAGVGTGAAGVVMRRRRR